MASTTKIIRHTKQTVFNQKANYSFHITDAFRTYRHIIQKPRNRRSRTRSIRRAVRRHLTPVRITPLQPTQVGRMPRQRRHRHIARPVRQLKLGRIAANLTPIRAIRGGRSQLAQPNHASLGSALRRWRIGGQVHADDGELPDRWLSAGRVAEEFVAILVPFDRVKFIAAQVEQA